ncbi:MAG: dehydratase [Deltaproteobacteria bacterium]|nr:dehydratase [Deltaproteobacteria bacterium]
MKNVILNFNKKPSDILTLLQAFNSRKSRFNPDEAVPEIHVIRSGYRINSEQLNSFQTICGIPPTRHLHILYPFTLVYPYLMRILCRREMPFSQFKILNTRNHILMFRPIKPDEQLHLDCYNSVVRIIPKGLECDFKAEIFAGTEKVWENTITYFVPGKFGYTDQSYTQHRLEPIENPCIAKEWFLEAKNRFKFGRVSGDTNGIHYSSIYARMLGFKRDFAQPIRVIAACVSHLRDQAADKPAELDFLLKGPVYYENMLTLKNQKIGHVERFDLYCSGNEKPCIMGRLISNKNNRQKLI